MYPFANDGTFAPPSGQRDDQKGSGHYGSTSRQQNAPIICNSSFSELRWPGGSHQESYVPTNLASNASLWPSAAIPDPSFSPYGGGGWPGNQRLNDVRLGSSFGVPEGNADRSIGGAGVAIPVLEQAFPAAERAFPAFQPCPNPSLNWAQAPDSRWQSTSSWDPHVHTTRQHIHHSNSLDLHTMRLESPPFQLVASPATTGRSERRVIPTGPPPSIATTNFGRPSSHGDPVSVTSSIPRSRGERWDSSNETTFQCQWSRRCTAFITGNRRSVTGHLRDEHDFACDGEMIACAWGECATYMQRRNIPRHIIACHFAIKVTCPLCGLSLSRADANKKHRLACSGVKTPAVVGAMEEDEGGYF